MKNYFPVLLLIILFISCKSKDASEKVLTKDSTTTVVPVEFDSAAMITDNHYFWEAEVGNKNGLLMKKTTPISKDSLNTEIIINMINAEYPEIRLQFVRISQDTIFLKIKNSKYLTEQMGSSGGEAYLAEVTYNLTELNDISHVNFSFKGAVHASPGTYERINFVH